MAKAPEDQNMTQDAFLKDDQQTLINALETQQATLRRKVNTEKNPQIKAIHQAELQKVVNLINKLQGL